MNVTQAFGVGVLTTAGVLGTRELNDFKYDPWDLYTDDGLPQSDWNPSRQFMF